VRLAYFVTHPIQYQAPLLKRIARERDIDLRVFFCSNISVHGYSDKGFGGLRVKWDTPLLDGYSYEFLPGFRKNDTLSFATPLNYGIWSRLSEGGFDAVWTHGYYNFNCLHAMFAARLLRIPVILRSEAPLSDHTRPATTRIAKRLFFMMMKHVIHSLACIGEAHREYWIRYLGEDMPILFMPYAVDNQYFSNQAAQASHQREELREQLGLKPGFPIFLFVSKLQARKRCIDLVEAFLGLSQGHDTEVPAYLLIIGDGDERASIERRIRKAASANIQMLGFRNQSELPRFFDLCDVFVLPSMNEQWGLVVNEVLNAGRAVALSNEVGCHLDLVEDGVNGFIFPPQNVEALRMILRQFIADPALAAAMGREGLKKIGAYSFEQDVYGLRQALASCVPGFIA